MASNSGSARCRACGAELRLFSISNRDMQGLCRAWRGRHERACKSRTPAQRRAWAKKYVSSDPDDTNLTVDLDHAGFQDIPTLDLLS
ncbi:hypothetical protein IPC1147_34005 [Pseudomonas aeruginosa]|nr:hypothetical protein [Pseudomonas aeruginosa]MCO2541517.1 hypothetical protein [Pseudomonas aeruginosa]RQC70829.1 hypothetical protein IPC353_28480 [Pseudomonas aeruginosa]RRS16451.1 hypothetical protein IPC1107_34155 [Pseudomonas aeruginosa]RRS17808.1 hypothetical protein IPC1147_34005 [Pseudomonas aeruginosa]